MNKTFLWYATFKVLFTYDVSQKKGFEDPPSTPFQLNSEINLPLSGRNLAFKNNTFDQLQMTVSCCSRKVSAKQHTVVQSH